MKISTKYILILSFLFSAALQAQQQNSYSFYRQNMNLVNPAFAGADGSTTFTGIYRNQWQGVEHAPESQAFSFGTSAGKRVGLGLSLENDKTFVEKQVTVNVDFSYLLPLSETVELFLGLKAGGNFYDVNTSGLETWSYEMDPSLVGLSRFNPNVGVGALLQHENYYLSLSAPRIFETRRAREEEGVVTTAADRVHLYLSGGYSFDLSERFSLEPSFMLRHINGAPLSVDLTAVAYYQELFGFGAAYRTDKAISGLAYIRILEWLQFGYAYESSLRSELQNVNNGTHELMLKFVL